MRVVILESAEADLKELQRYIYCNFSRSVWQRTYSKIKETIRYLAKFPYLGAVPPELERLSLQQYRQVICGMNRIIYEIRQEVVYIHAIFDTRRDMQSFLLRRLLR